ncbi:hypothetical protein BDR06DRAFT_139941 [Suillus hirtellus]|nr:hypothetical protein BDR06DRAFT_139941 [Suillus hirtellus]
MFRLSQLFDTFYWSSPLLKKSSIRTSSSIPRTYLCVVLIALFKKAASRQFDFAARAFTDLPWTMIVWDIFGRRPNMCMHVRLGTVPQYWILFLYWLPAQDLSTLPTSDSLYTTEAILEAASPMEEVKNSPMPLSTLFARMT